MIGTVESIGIHGWVYPTDVYAVGSAGWFLADADTPSGELPDADTIRLYRRKNIIKGPAFYGEIPRKYLDPDSRDLYFFDWSEDLEPEDTIQISDIVIDGAITYSATDLICQIAPVWLSGIALGDRVTVTSRITTSTGRILDKSFYVMGRHQ